MKDWRELSLFPPVLSSLKLPVGWLDFLRNRPREWWEGGEFSWIVGLQVAVTMIAVSGEARDQKAVSLPTCQGDLSLTWEIFS